MRPGHDEAVAPLSSGEPILRALGLQKRFGRTVALKEGTFSAHQGEIVAVMGPSGSGKTTLLQCMAGILRPDSGTVTYAGRRLDDLGDEARSVLRRTTFGFVFQSGQLVPELNATENVALPLLLNGRRRRESFEVARDWLASVGLDGLETRRPGEMSGGEAQRVAVARAMAISPGLIFADEPTGALDSVSGEAVLKTLIDVAGENGAAVIIVTHDERVASHAHRVVDVCDGVVRESRSRQHIDSL